MLFPLLLRPRPCASASPSLPPFGRALDRARPRRLPSPLPCLPCPRPRSLCLLQVFVIADGSDFPLFSNASIDRRMSRELRRAVLEHLASSGVGQWLDPEHRRLLVLWRSPSAWADEIDAWARAAGLEGSVVSFEELLGGDEVVGASFEGMPRPLLKESLAILEKKGRARMFKGGDGDDVGVKFQ